PATSSSGRRRQGKDIVQEGHAADRTPIRNGASSISRATPSTGRGSAWSQTARPGGFRSSFTPSGSRADPAPAATLRPALASIAAAGEALLDARLGRGEPCAGDEEWRARDVIHPDLVAELDRRGLAAMLATDPNLQVRPPTSAAVDTEL